MKFIAMSCIKNKGSLRKPYPTGLLFFVGILCICGNLKSEIINENKKLNSEITTLDLYAERRKLDKESQDRFFYKTQPQKDGSVIFFHNSQKPKKCKGHFLAKKAKIVMNEIRNTEDLCWHVDSGSSAIILTDPKAYFFSTQKLESNSLIYIKSELELQNEDRLKKIDAIKIRADESRRSRADCIIFDITISCL